MDGSVIRPPKDIWLQETAASDHSSTFEIYQVFDNLIRRGLALAGGRTERRITVLSTETAGDDTVRSALYWKVPAATGLRLRALYEFRNDFGVRSPRLMAHRFAKAGLRGTARGDVDLMPLVGVPVGFGGEGAIDTEVLFAVDPEVRLRVVQPWSDGGRELSGLARDSYAELAELAPELGVDVNAATRAFEDIFSDFLPAKRPGDWSFQAPEPGTVKGDEGDVIRSSVQIQAKSPGRSLIAVEVQNLEDPSKVAFSEMVAIEVTERLDIILLRGSEIAARPVAVPYGPGSLSPEQIQAEIDRMWRSRGEDRELVQAITASGVDIGDLAFGRAPLRVAEGVAGFAPGSILLSAVGDAALALWREVFLPRIRERHGASALRGERPRE